MSESAAAEGELLPLMMIRHWRSRNGRLVYQRVGIESWMLFAGPNSTPDDHAAACTLRVGPVSTLISRSLDACFRAYQAAYRQPFANRLRVLARTREWRALMWQGRRSIHHLYLGRTPPASQQRYRTMRGWQCGYNPYLLEPSYDGWHARWRAGGVSPERQAFESVFQDVCFATRTTALQAVTDWHHAHADML